ncbi:MAG: T9SS type A sorting domain-containing protein [Saprospiraceae bacterium]|nr:T9SS type A sorting domain-containing protein [Saprospiraceae bacterium]
MEQMGTLVIDNAASYTILGSKTISITWLCNEDPSGVIYACGSDNATAINLCEQPCTGGFQYCLRVSCDTLCVTLRGQQTTFVVSSSNSTPKFFCFDYPIATVSQYPCGAGGGIGYQMQGTDLVPNETVNFAVPNPATDLVKINVPVNMIGKNMIQVLGIDGKTIYSRNFEGSEFDINTSQWPAGVYQVKLRNNESEVQQKLLIVR